MKKKLYQVSAYFRHLFRASGAASIHSPFLFELYTQVLNRYNTYYAFTLIETRRKELLQDHSHLVLQDFGAGTSVPGVRNTTVSSIVSISSQPERTARLLFCLVNHFRPKTILELGTSLGIGTAYLAMANTDSRVITVEGDPSLAALARKTFESLGLKHVESICGNFDTVVPDLLRSMDKIDLIYLDGNHQLKPTLRYYEWLRHHCHSGTIIVVDDIHWSREMNVAWKILCSEPDIHLDLDLFRLGILFFRPEIEKQHFILKLP